MSVVTRTVVIGGTIAILIIAGANFPTDGLTSIARAEIPGQLVDTYKSAARTCRGLPWQVVAAIGWVESGHRQAPDPTTGKHPAFATARNLCGGAPVLDDLNRAIRREIHSPSQVMEVLIKAGRYGLGDGVPDVDALVAAATADAGPLASGAVGTAGAAVVQAALQVLGTPYVWGAESPSDGFDCSGLVWWAYRQTGVDVARTTEQLIASGRPLRDGDRLRAGDLLFTRGGRPVRDLGHVGIYAGNGLQVVAPRSGKSVTVQEVDMGEVQAVRRILAA